MIHRRLLNDDHKGLVEPLNEIDPRTYKGIEVYTTHYIFYGN